jgi:hypothetical protein
MQGFGRWLQRSGLGWLQCRPPLPPGRQKDGQHPCKVLPGPFLQSSYWMLIGIVNERVTTAPEGAGSVPVAKTVTLCGPAGTGVK